MSFNSGHQPDREWSITQSLAVSNCFFPPCWHVPDTFTRFLQQKVHMTPSSRSCKWISIFQCQWKHAWLSLFLMHHSMVVYSLFEEWSGIRLWYRMDIPFGGHSAVEGAHALSSFIVTCGRWFECWFLWDDVCFTTTLHDKKNSVMVPQFKNHLCESLGNGKDSGRNKPGKVQSSCLPVMLQPFSSCPHWEYAGV